jgi:hypothetical protein
VHSSWRIRSAERHLLVSLRGLTTGATCEPGEVHAVD